MGIEPEITTADRLDYGLLLWPKRLLLIIYAGLLVWNMALLYGKPMYEEEYVIRLTYIAFLIGMMGFIFVNHRWAMSSAFAIQLCFTVALFMFGITGISILSVGFHLFLGTLTLRTLKVADILDAVRSKSTVEVFE